MVMDRWSDLIQKSLQRSKVKLFHVAKYGDDIDVVTDIIKEGYRWQENGEGNEE